MPNAYSKTSTEIFWLLNARTSVEETIKYSKTLAMRDAFVLGDGAIY